MIRSFLFSLVFLSFVFAQHPLEAGLWDSIKGWFIQEEASPPPTIRILVADDLDEATLEVSGRYALHDPYTDELVSHRFLGKSGTIKAIRSGLKWEEEFPGIYQLKIVPLDPATMIRVNDVDYQGSLYIYDTGGTISMVNEIDLEEYLSCTLSFYLDDNLSREAMAALAITARTNAYYQVMHPRNTYWTVNAEHVDFHGCDVPRLSRIDEAIHTTSYMVLSSTGPYDGATTPFLASWGPISSVRSTELQGKITFEQAQEMAEKGAHAAQILAKAFPGSSIMLTKTNE